MHCSTADTVHSGALTVVILCADTLIRPTRVLLELMLPDADCATANDAVAL
jgi:hypothetical protein